MLYTQHSILQYCTLYTYTYVLYVAYDVTTVVCIHGMHVSIHTTCCSRYLHSIHQIVCNYIPYTTSVWSMYTPMVYTHQCTSSTYSLYSILHTVCVYVQQVYRQYYALHHMMVWMYACTCTYSIHSIVALVVHYHYYRCYVCTVGTAPTLVHHRQLCRE